MANPWIEHIKEYARRNNMTYMCALSNPQAVAEYRAKKTAKSRKMKPTK